MRSVPSARSMAPALVAARTAGAGAGCPCALIRKGDNVSWPAVAVDCSVA